MVLELEFENIVFSDIIAWTRNVHTVSKKGKAGKGKIILKGFVKVQTEVSEHNPELLPPIGVFELPQQVARQLVFKGSLVIHDRH